MRALLVVALLLAPASAAAAELSIQPRAGIAVLGLDAPTGGASAGLNGRVLWKLQETPDAGVYAGAGADVIGLQGGWYHMGIIAGPRAGAWMQWRSLFVSAGVGALYGQLSLCRTLVFAGARQCMRWWNVWPEGALHVGFRNDDMHVGLDITSMLLRPTWGTDASIGLAASGSWR